MSKEFPIATGATEQLTASQQFFLSMLADHLNKRPTSAPAELDWDAVLRYARSHQVEAILYSQCKAFLPEHCLERLTKCYASSAFFYTNRIAALKNIQACFEKEQIPFYTVKGLDVAQLYPCPPFRTMGDLDILIHSEDRERARKALLSLGFEDESTNAFEINLVRNQLKYEIHDRLLYDNSVNSQISKDYCDQAWSHAKQLPDSVRYTLDWDFHFVYLLFHLKKHFLVSGVGFRQFMDLALVVQHCQINWEALTSVLEQLEILDFAKVCLSFCGRWFDKEMPLTMALDEDFYTLSTQKIFGNGVFGFDDASNRENANLNTLRKKGKFMTVVSRIFPSYQDVCNVPYYSFVCNRPYLLPAVWVYRFYRAIRHHLFGRGKQLIEKSFVDQAKMNQHDAMLRFWGL